MSATPPGPEQPGPGGWQPPSGAGQWEQEYQQQQQQQPGGAGQWGAPPGAQWGGGPPPNRDTNGKAITSLVLGIGGFLVCPIILSVAAIVIGGQARNEIRASQGRQTGEGMAKAGVILGWVSLALSLIFFIGIVAFGVFGSDADTSSGGSEESSDPVNVITFGSDAVGALSGLL